jgi:hypothetical protein
VRQNLLAVLLVLAISACVACVDRDGFSIKTVVRVENVYDSYHANWYTLLTAEDGSTCKVATTGVTSGDKANCFWVKPEAAPGER